MAFASHAVFADADHGAGRSLYADTLEQLGYGAENGTWRNFFVERPADDKADATLTSTKGRMLRLLAGDTSSPGMAVAGDGRALDLLLSVLEKGDPSFNIMTP